MRRIPAVLLTLTCTALLAMPAAADPPRQLGHTGRWLTDPGGRVVLVHGLNMVAKLAPYAPDALGFDDDDAAFLAGNGFDAVRLGLTWKAVEPEPGRYDDAYLRRIADTVGVLERHGIRTLLDFHQDLYNERFQGEGAPDWAVLDDGLPPIPRLGFPLNYFGMPALQRAYDRFWANDPGPGGVGLQDRYAAAWAHVAAYFRGRPSVLGYDLFNEPWPGTQYPTCLLPIGCPVFDKTLTAFGRRVATAIRAADADTLVFGEPNPVFNVGALSWSGPIGVERAGLSFHDYCLTAAVTNTNIGCPPFDDAVFRNAESYAKRTGEALLLTEFGATDDTELLSGVVSRAGAFKVGWLYWAYCGCGDPTTTGAGDAQALVFDPAKPPTGTNVDEPTLRALAVPHPRAVAGTPTSYGFDAEQRVFRLTYRTDRADGQGGFPAGARTSIAIPALHYPTGYRVTVTGGRAVTPPGAAVLEIAADAGATEVTVTVAPA